MLVPVEIPNAATEFPVALLVVFHEIYGRVRLVVAEPRKALRASVKTIDAEAPVKDKFIIPRFLPLLFPV